MAGFESGAHQKSSGSTLLLPSTMKAMTRPTFDGLNTCEPLRRTMNFVNRENAAMPENIHHWWKLQWSPTGVLGTRKINAMPLPVSIALAGQTKARFSRKVIATCKTKHVSIAERICGTLT